MRNIFIYVYIVIFVLTKGKLIHGKEYEITLRDEGTAFRSELLWKVQYQSESVEFTLKITQKFPRRSLSFFGLGMSDCGDVTNADVIMIRYDKDGVVIQDSWTDKDGVIHQDTQEDYHLIEYDVKKYQVSIVFSRSFDTGDASDYKLDKGTTNLFYLMEPEDESSGSMNSDLFFPSLEDVLKQLDPEINAKDLETGIIPVQILRPDLPNGYFSDGKNEEVFEFNVLQPNISLPAQVTTYWCSVHKLPDDISHKVHGIGFGANLTKENKNIIHHMEVFLCDPKDGEISYYSGICEVPAEPDDVKRCYRVVGAWAMGAEDIFYPKEAGIPFGGKDQSRYFRLEIHYNNPEKIENLIDSSGMTFYYTKQIRQYDAGILEVGLTYNDHLGIPPHQNDFMLSGYCPAKCTTEGIHPGGIKVFASQLHTHLTGRTAEVKHYRNGKTLPDVNNDPHYWTMFEEIRQLYPPVEILPGDSLVTSCTYNTLSRDKFTTTGDAATNEMCVSYLHYYPLSPLEVCKSSTSSSALEEFFLIEKLFTGYPEVLNFTDLGQNYYAMKWNEAAVRDLATTYRKAPKDIECKGHTGEQLSGNWDDVLL